MKAGKNVKWEVKARMRKRVYTITRSEERFVNFSGLPGQCKICQKCKWQQVFIIYEGEQRCEKFIKLTRVYKIHKDKQTELNFTGQPK